MQGRASRFQGGGPQYVIGLVVMGLLPSLPAAAAITLTSDPLTLAQAIEHTAGTVTGASFVALPPNGTPHGTGDSALLGFPTDGGTFTILTTGDAALADQPNTASDSGADDGGGNVRGGSNWDVSILKIDLDVPPLANCLSFDFQFLSDEFPEWVGNDFNDAFIAELDNSTWTTSGPTITAPDNFAFDPLGSMISINDAGVTSMTAANATGTTYDGATPLLGAATPITSGAHSLYLSIFDIGNRGIDSAVFLDRLVLGTTDSGACQSAATILSVSKSINVSAIDPGGSVQYTVTVNNPSAGAVSVNTILDLLPNGFSYVPGSTTGATTADPMISGQSLTWSGPFTLPANSSISLQFTAVTPLVPGDYFNNASATATNAQVVPSGPAAEVTVGPLPLGLCGMAPQSGCRSTTAASFLLSRNTNPARSKIQWKFEDPGATSQLYFGDPLTTTKYAFCAYDYSSGNPTLIMEIRVPAGGTCGTRPCWKGDPDGPDCDNDDGYRYHDRKHLDDGLYALWFRTKCDIGAHVNLQAHGTNLVLPPPVTPLQYLAQDPQVTLELNNSDGQCWQSTFSQPPTVNSGKVFRDKY